MPALKITTGRLFLILVLGLSMAAVVSSITGCVSDEPASSPNQSPPYFKPTFSGDDHTPPVYTSPSVTPATTNLPASNVPP
jgi:hypothetical protein